MNERIKAQWIEALESGEYKQGKELLRLEDGTYCCLGVLCDLYLKETNGTWDRAEGRDVWAVEKSATSAPPPTVIAWAGMPVEMDSMFDYVEEDHRYTLVEHNDSDCYSFIEIADIIREHF